MRQLRVLIASTLFIVGFIFFVLAVFIRTDLYEYQIIFSLLIFIGSSIWLVLELIISSRETIEIPLALNSAFLIALSKIILDNPEPNDIIQENEADSNFVSALSCIAEKSNLIKRLFISDDISKHGIYILKLCVKGIWKKIVIDDLFPCYPNGNPFVSHSSSFEIWILLLEKALAKINQA